MGGQEVEHDLKIIGRWVEMEDNWKMSGRWVVTEMDDEWTLK